MIGQPQDPNTDWAGKVEVFYGYARDPRTRFWRAVEVNREDSQWVARCPVMELDEPLYLAKGGANSREDVGLDTRKDINR